MDDRFWVDYVSAAFPHRGCMPEPTSHEDDGKPRSDSFMDGHWGFMFPEVIAGPGLLIASPIWLVSLLRQGTYGAAACLAVGALAGGAIMALGFSRRSSTIVHLALVVLLATGALTFKLL